MSCYFDDFVSFTTPALAKNTQAALCLMLDILVGHLTKWGPRHTSVGRLLVGNTQKRVEESIVFGQSL